MQSKAQLYSLMYDGKGQQIVSFTFSDDIANWADEYQGIDLNIKIEPFKAKRTLDANGYFWALLDEVCKRMKLDKIDAYKTYIKHLAGVSDTVCVKSQAVDKLVEGWKHNGLGWFAEVDESKIAGCKNVTLFYGSSSYDKDQMSRLIDLVVQDAKTLGIPCKNDDQIKSLLELYQ